MADQEYGRTVQTEKFRLAEDITRKCPECEADVSLSRSTMDAEILNCPDCSFEMEVVFDPSTLNLTELARRVRKGESPYDVSKLDLTVSPTLVPAPQEEEDWGE